MADNTRVQTMTLWSLSAVGDTADYDTLDVFEKRIVTGPLCWSALVCDIEYLYCLGRNKQTLCLTGLKTPHGGFKKLKLKMAGNLDHAGQQNIVRSTICCLRTRQTLANPRKIRFHKFFGLFSNKGS